VKKEDGRPTRSAEPRRGITPPFARFRPDALARGPNGVEQREPMTVVLVPRRCVGESHLRPLAFTLTPTPAVPTAWTF